MATEAAAACFSHPVGLIFAHLSSPRPRLSRSPSPSQRSLPKPPSGRRLASAALLASGAGLALAASAQALPFGPPVALTVLQEPANALSLPTWVIHVSSVIEWITAMALVWEYGEKSGFGTWKGLSWGMVPLLGGALCACTWHFFYNSPSLEILVALQAALTVIGNITMCIAAFRIFKASQEGSKSS
ncbi:ycf49-like protein [Phoenix dactylifera]|uniref:Ycf49-like protein n=1 Tax=Phoenix dactylifera TaxID=42345 RepID=A0A8B8ZQU0_PHODC|nr:ycf49-like protein [Phoenix dactylifera]XP_038973862.1 ycf49-like protein [Phoenix dactylifera]XP_038973863.1 ycf49-like protein [Phoenix dactylifera]